MEPVTNPQQEILDSLSEMYSLLKEEDLWAGLWQTVAHYAETRQAVTYEQHGFLEQALAALTFHVQGPGGHCCETIPWEAAVRDEVVGGPMDQMCKGTESVEPCAGVWQQ
ncbi:transformation/transcription domain-associated protein-like [Homarus americanus]|uniref:transformation/transcription domain-associated protein-like n=1 Tax=Homarus americanus TaxID=6706 RepID=UPI001C450EA4|nr:transformation/transcription domain-associated protein-like [Homarus americanus]